MIANVTKQLTVVALAVTGGYLAAPAATTHEEGVIELASEAVRAGGTVSVQGEHFSEGTYQLVLKGALREYELDSVAVGDTGTFHLELAVPPQVEPGAYRVVVVASDGDEAAMAELEVLAAVQSAPADEGHDHAEAGGQLPSAAELELQRSWSGAEWFVIGVLFGGALAGGVTLLRRRRAP